MTNTKIVFPIGWLAGELWVVVAVVIFVVVVLGVSLVSELFKQTDKIVISYGRNTSMFKTIMITLIAESRGYFPSLQNAPLKSSRSSDQTLRNQVLKLFG